MMRGSWERRIGWCALLLAAACGGENDADDSAGTPDADSGGSSMGSGETTSVAEPPVPPSSLPQAACEAGDWDLSGTLDGESFVVSGDISGDSFFSRVTSESSVEGASAITGFLHAPESEMGEGIFCVDEGSLEADDDSRSVALIGHRIPGCSAATPVLGELFFCRDTGGDGCDASTPALTPRLNGELEGVAIDEPEGGSYFGGSGGVIREGSQFDLTVDFDEMLYIGESVTVTGQLFAKADSEVARTAYCFTGTVESLESGPDLIHLTAIAKAGSCSEAGPSDSLTGCIGR